MGPLLALTLLAGFGGEWTPAELEALAAMSPLEAPPADPTNRVADDPAAARLGQWLFFDPSLSGNGRISCATCHDPAKGFSDGKSVAETLGRGTRRTPTVVNAAYQRWLFWDGRVDSLWAQAVQPIENPLEMGGDRRAVAGYLAREGDLRRAYEQVFGAPPDPGRADLVFANVGKAIAAYERRLVRGDAPFDRYVAHLTGRPGGDEGALDSAARRGLHLFLGRARCSLCHSGPSFSDSEFHNTAAPPGEWGDPQDPGRYRGLTLLAADPFNAAGPFSDAPQSAAARRLARLRHTTESFGAFRTPSLRNLAHRAPYMHAGQFKTLGDVLRFYSTREELAPTSHHQESILRPLNLSPTELADLEAFLLSLEGRPLDPSLLRAPSSPLL